MIETILLSLGTIIFGMCIGSFMNVCIYRIPIGKSIVYPSSSCPHCSEKIRIIDIIPIFSYLWLKGRCGKCHASIPLRSPVVEILTGLIAFCLFLKFGITIEGNIFFLFICALLVITFIDIDHRIIPDSITYTYIILSLFSIPFLNDMTYKQSILGILIGGGSLFVVAFLYQIITKREGMGGGDIKLLAMIGAFTGVKGVIFSLLLGSLLGSIVGVLIMLITQKDMKLAIPFGPFLSIGAITYIFGAPDNLFIL